MSNDEVQNFVGRKHEIELLQEKNWRGHAPLMVVYGRRRIGKTALIEYALKDHVIWKFEGLENAPKKQQILNFVEQLTIYSGKKQIESQNIKTWREAFYLLDQHLDQKKVIVFFDEFQWLANMKSSFVSLFKYFWDNYFQKHKNCCFIICGSVSSFIVKKVLYSKALYGRVDTEIHLQGLSLHEVALFFPKKLPQELLEIYMTFGGVPKYLLELHPKLSYLQNLNEFAFKQNGFFLGEFGRLFISHFSSTPHYEKILTTLANTKKDMSQLAKVCGTKKGGNFSQVLNDLVLADFIEKETPLDKKLNSKILRYKLKDAYLNFYFSFLVYNIPAIQKGQFQFHHLNVRKLEQWHGYAFERLCRQHSDDIASYLKFSGIQYEQGPWFRKNDITSTQVDLMFIRKDKVITLCELKYKNQISPQIIQEFQKKVEAIQQYFPSYGIQKVLLLGKEAKRSPKIYHYFDEVLLAQDVFF